MTTPYLQFRERIEKIKSMTQRQDVRDVIADFERLLSIVDIYERAIADLRMDSPEAAWFVEYYIDQALADADKIKGDLV